MNSMSFRLTFCTIAASGIACGAVTRPQPAAACDASWRVIPLWAQAPGAAPSFPLDRPTGIRFGSTYLLAGNTKDAHHRSLQGDSSIIIGLDGRRVELPPAARGGIGPVLGASGDTLYLLWGEPRPKTEADGERWPPVVSAVWFAGKVGDAPWSAPKQIVRAAVWVEWGQDHVSRVLRTPDGALELAFSASQSASNAALFLIRLAGGDATVHSRPLEGSASNTRMVRRGDTAWVLLVKADESRRRDQNSLFITRWHSTNRSRSPLQLVQRGGDQGVLYPQAAVTADGQIHVVWTQSVKEGLRAELLRHVSTRDGGATWSAAEDMPREGAWPQDLLVIGENAVSVVLIEHDWTHGPQLMTACWRSGWGNPRPILNDGRLFNYAWLASDPPAFVATRRRSDGQGWENVLVTRP